MIEGHKDCKGKADWSVVPLDGMDGIIRVFEKGQIEHCGYRTWLPGIRYSKLFSAIMRHLTDWFFKGLNKDRKSGEHPLCHVAANCLMLLTYIPKKQVNGFVYDDRPCSSKSRNTDSDIAEIDRKPELDRRLERWPGR